MRRRLLEGPDREPRATGLRRNGEPRQKRHAESPRHHLRERRQARRPHLELPRPGARADLQRLLAEAVAVVEQQNARPLSSREPRRPLSRDEGIPGRRRQDEGIARDDDMPRSPRPRPRAREAPRRGPPRRAAPSAPPSCPRPRRPSGAGTSRGGPASRPAAGRARSSGSRRRGPSRRAGPRGAARRRAGRPTPTRIRRARSMRSRPVAVTRTRRRSRSKSVTPRPFSSAATWAESDGCATRQSSAALRNERVSATATAYWSCRSVKGCGEVGGMTA